MFIDDVSVLEVFVAFLVEVFLALTAFFLVTFFLVTVSLEAFFVVVFFLLGDVMILPCQLMVDTLASP